MHSSSAGSRRPRRSFGSHDFAHDSVLAAQKKNVEALFAKAQHLMLVVMENLLR